MLCDLLLKPKTTKSLKSIINICNLFLLFLFIKETMLRPIFVHRFLLELPQMFFLSHWLLLVIYLGTVRAPGTVVHSGHA